MEKSLANCFPISLLNLLEIFLVKPAKCVAHLHLIIVFVCLSVLCFCTDASWKRGTCQPGRALETGHLKSIDGIQLQLLEGFHSIHSCQAACCQTPACDAFWLLGKMCIQVNCTMSQKCQEIRTDTTDSVVVFVRKHGHHLAKERNAELPKWLHWKEGHQSGTQRFIRELPDSRAHLANVMGNALKRDVDSSDGRPANHPVPSEPLDEIPPHQDLAEPQSAGQEANNKDTEELKSRSQSTPNSGSVNRLQDLGRSNFSATPPGDPPPEPSSATMFPGLLENSEKTKQSSNASSNPFPLEEVTPTSRSLQEDSGKVQQISPVPTGTPFNVTAALTDSAVVPSTPAPTPVMKKLAVSAGDSVQVTLPKNEVELNAYVLPPPPEGSSYSYDWRLITHPKDYSGEMEGQHSQILKLSKLTVGLYEFNVIVDGDNAHGEGMVNVTVKPELNQPPVAKIVGNSISITLPTDTAELDGSRSTDDKGIITFLWTRDESSPAAGEVLNNSDHHPLLLLSNLVEGSYTFHLKVTDAKGESDVDRATVDVKPDPRKSNLVEMILDVNVSHLTERQKGMFIRQIGVLLGVLDSDITVQKIQPYTEKSTKMVFYVRNQSPHQIFKGHDVARTLRSELRKQQSDFLIFRALEINTVTCQLNCSEHGLCDSFTKRCICDPFWMENFIKVQIGDGESNCEWSVLYVVIASFVIVVSLGIFSWLVVCCCKKRKGKPKRKSKYKILDATDQESLELKPNSKAGGKQKCQAQNTSLMHSESELDSDEAIFTWPDREKGKLLHHQNGTLQNGQVVLKPKNQQEEEVL